MELYLFVLDITEWQLKSLVGFYQEQQAVYGTTGVQNLLEVSFTPIGGEWVLGITNSHKTYPKTLAQRELWVKGLAGFLRNILGKEKVVYNER